MTQFRHSVLGFCAVLVLACSACGEEPPSLDTTPSQQPSSSTYTGVVVEGTEAGCLLLDTGNERYLLLGGDRDQLKPKSKVTVTGAIESGTPSTCMEGTPLQVEKASPAT